MDWEILLRSQSWLSDAIINAAQERGNPIGKGLNFIGKMLIFLTIERGEFVQILHTGQSHWQVVSTIGTQHPEVNIYDSVYCSCSHHSKIQIASILATIESNIKLRYMDVQMQFGAADCGIFAIAFATTLTHGYLPGQYFVCQSAMWAHLL